MGVKKGYKQTEVGVIPEDWDVETLGKMATFKTGPFGSALHKSDYIEDGIPVINPMHIVDGKLFPSARMTISDAAAKRLSDFCLKANEIVIGRRGDMGRCAVVIDQESGCLCGTGSMIIRPNNKANPHYLQIVLSSEKAIKAIEETSVGTTMVNLNQGVLSGLKIQFPSLAEQTAIATALSDANALIESIEQLIAKKRDIKQGAMQELLTGKKRLPGFSGEWEVKEICEISTVGRGWVISHREIAKALNPRYPVYSSQTSNDGIMGFLDTFQFEGEYVTWTTDGANAGTVFHRTGRFNCTNVCGTIRLHEDNHAFVSKVLGKEAPAYVSRHLGNPKLMNDVMKRIKVKLPKDKKEQAAIADILSDMDSEITTLEQKLEKARAVKQGMMQELLTGRVRLV